MHSVPVDLTIGPHINNSTFVLVTWGGWDHLEWTFMTYQDVIQLQALYLMGITTTFPFSVEGFWATKSW